MKNTLRFTYTYVLITIMLLLALICNIKLLQLGVKTIFSVLIYTTYFRIVPKEKIQQKYLLILFFIFMGEFFLVDSYQYFEYVALFYLVAHVLFTRIIYKNYLRNESKFDVFTFSLPFLLTFSIVYILLNLEFYWQIGVIIFGVVACVNSSTVLLNYANNRTKQNFLFFLGTFLWLVADAFGGIYRFRAKEGVYHILGIITDFIAQYLICRAFLLDAKNDTSELIKTKW